MDILAREYGWTGDYILDQSYSAIAALLLAISIRQYHQIHDEYNIRVLASSGKAIEVEEFFERRKPKAEHSEEYEMPTAEVVLPRGMQFEEA